MISIPFFEALPVVRRFEDTADPTNYFPVPDDWFVAITDVRNSTIAIQQGRYKEVNAMGAVFIMGVLNMTGSFNFPFVFGGDGATIVLPGELRKRTAEVMRGVQNLAKVQFGLEIRAGLVPVRSLRAAGQDVRVARMRISDYFTQAAFLGGGIQYADKLLKAPEAPSEFFAEHIAERLREDFSGLECRWDEVKNDRGEVHAVLVEALGEDLTHRNRIYQDVYRRIAEIYGTEEEYRPVATDKLNLTLNNRKLQVEKKVRTFGTTRREQIGYWIKLRLQWLTGKLVMNLGIRTAHTDWGRYKQDLAENTDYRKFDDMLRLVLAGTETQRFTLQGYLETLYERGDVVYGIHASGSALITCMILDHQQGHIHLVDGNDGGYALAAKRMKERARARKNG